MKNSILKYILKRKDGFFSFFFFGMVSLAITWPLAYHPGGFLLPQKYNSVSDILHSDTLEHLAHLGLAREKFLYHENFFVFDFADVAQTYIFFGIATYFFGISVNVSHNLYFIISVFLSGYCMYFLCKEILKDEAASLWGGFLYMSSSYVFSEYVYGHSNLWQIQWIPLIFLFLEKFLRSPRYVFSFLLGIAIALQVFSSTQYTIYMSFVACLYVIFRVAINPKTISFQNIWKKIVLLCVVLFALAGTFILQKIALHPNVAVGIFSYQGWSVNSFFEFFDPAKNIFFGYAIFVPIIVGSFFIFQRNQRRDFGFLYIFSIMFFIFIFLMFGPASVFYPYTWLYWGWPFFQYIRTPYRFFPFALMCIGIISSLFLSKIRTSFSKQQFFFVVFALIMFTLLLRLLFSPWFFGRHILYL